MKISKIYGKVTDRYKKFRKHPLTKNAPFLALLRYLKFNLLNSFSNKTRIYKWVNGLRFYAQKGDAGIVPNIYFKLFDYEESMFVLEHISENDLFVDIGANMGHFSLLAASKGAKVISVEPIPSTYKKLKKNIQLNSFAETIEAKNIGIGSKKGTLRFICDKDVMNKVAIHDTVNTIEVKVDTLDNLLFDLSPKMIKIDVEGYEKFVLIGGDNVLKNRQLSYLLVELNQSSEMYNISDNEIHNFILGFGFVPIAYNVEEKRFLQLNSFNKHVFNTLYARKELVV